MLDGVVALDVQGKGLRAQVPDDALGARRGGQGSSVLVDAVGVQVGSQTRKVQVVGLGESTGGGNIINVGKDGVEERSRVTELGKLENEANDGDIAS